MLQSIQCGLEKVIPHFLVTLLTEVKQTINRDKRMYFDLECQNENIQLLM
jgi:hypothetical protein